MEVQSFLVLEKTPFAPWNGLLITPTATYVVIKDGKKIIFPTVNIHLLLLLPWRGRVAEFLTILTSLCRTLLAQGQMTKPL